MMEFPGALVLVTHDRYLLDRVSRQILALNGKGQANYYADLAQWEDAQGETEPEPPPLARETPVARNESAPVKESKPGLSRQDLKELKAVEANLRAAETRLAQARRALEDPAIAAHASELVSRQKALGAAQEALDALLERWEALEARRT